MKQKVYYNQEMPEYQYFKLNNGRADVYIREYIGQETVMTGESSELMYAYYQNEFNVNQNDITEEMIINNPQAYINYNPTKNESLEEKIRALENRTNLVEDAVMELFLGGINNG